MIKQYYLIYRLDPNKYYLTHRWDPNKLYGFKYFYLIQIIGTQFYGLVWLGFMAYQSF